MAEKLLHNDILQALCLKVFLGNMNENEQLSKTFLKKFNTLTSSHFRVWITVNGWLKRQNLCSCWNKSKLANQLEENPTQSKSLTHHQQKHHGREHSLMFIILVNIIKKPLFHQHKKIKPHLAKNKFLKNDSIRPSLC